MTKQMEREGLDKKKGDEKQKGERNVGVCRRVSVGSGA